MKKNYYEILEVSENASPEVIEKAFKALSKKYHPDVNPKYKEPWAEDEFKKIVAAYEVLSDVDQKAEYDEELALIHEGQKVQQEKLFSKKKEKKPNPFHIKRYSQVIVDAVYRHTKKSKKERSKDITAVVYTAVVMIILILLFWKVPFLNKLLFP